MAGLLAAAVLALMGFGAGAAHAQTYPEDFSLASSNTDPEDIWSDGTNVWVVDSADQHVYAYSRRSGTRQGSGCSTDPGMEICIGGTQKSGSHRGIWGDGTHAWLVVDTTSGQAHTHQYQLSDRTFVRTINLNASTVDPRGMCAHGSNAWVLDENDNMLEGYTIANSTSGAVNAALNRDTTRDISLFMNNTEPRGCFTDGTTIWVADESDHKLYAYDVATRTRDAPKEIETGVVGTVPTGLWGDPDSGLLLMARDGSLNDIRGIHYRSETRYRPVGTVMLGTGQAASVDEGMGPVAFSILFSPDLPASTQVTYNLAQMGDFVSSTGSASLVSSTASGEFFVDVSLVDDMNSEDAGWISVSLEGSAHYIVGSPSVVTVAITDNDGPMLPEVDFALTSPTAITEGVDMVFAVTLPGGGHSADLEASARLQQSGEWLGGETDETRTFTIPAGTAALNYTVATDDDNTEESNGSVLVTFTVAGDTHTVTGPNHTVNIDDNDGVPIVTVDAAAGPEGFAALFRVYLLPADRGEITGAVCDCTVNVNWEAAETTDASVPAEARAMAGTDFTAAMGQLTFAPGTNEHYVTVSLGVADEDTDEEVFDFILRSPLSAALESGGMAVGDSYTVRGTIQELPGLMIARDDEDGTITEGEAAVFTVSMTRVPADGAEVVVPVTVVQTGNVLGAAPESVTIPAGDTSVKLNIPLDNDARDEADGSITVTISLPAGREADFLFSGAMEAMLAVTDDDDAPSVSALAAPTAREGDALMFPVELSGASERVITVIYTTEAGDERATATAAERDYDAATGTLTFNPDETAALVAVQTHRDTEKDPDEIVVLTLSEPANATLGTASAAGTISEGLSDAEIDALNEAILPHVITAVAEETTGAVEDRVRAAFEGGGEASAKGLSIRGASPGQFLEGLLPGEVSALVRHSRESGNPEIPGTALDSPEIEGKSRGNDGVGGDAFHGETSALSFGDWSLPEFSAADFDFNAALNADGGAGAMPMNLWGRGYYRDLSVDVNPIEFEGDVTGFTLGADARLSDAFLAGVALNRAVADVDWNDGNFTGRHETTMTGVHPYFGWRLDGGLLMWGSVGYGQGELELTEEGNDAFLYERDLSIGTVALGGYGPLPSAGPVDFGIVSDFTYTRTDSDAAAAAVEAGWLRVGAEADYSLAFSDGSAFSAKGELALREDFGDAKTGTGVELGTQVDYRHPAGLRVDLKARALLAHRDDNEVEEWGISGGIAFSTSAARGTTAGRGLSLSFSPEWGATAPARDQLWNGGFAANRAGAVPSAGNGLGASPRHSRASGNLEGASPNYRHSRGSYPQAQGNPEIPGIALDSRLRGNDERGRGEMPSLRYNLELKYGIPVMQGRELLTFFARSDLRFESRNYALGADLKLGSHFTAGYESTLNRYDGMRLFPAAQDAAAVDHRAYLRFEKRFH